MANTNPGGPRKQLKLDTVRVKNGQSLASIARSHGVSLTKLYELNPALRMRREAGKTVVYNNSVVKLPGTGKYEMSSARKTTTATLGKVSGRQAAAYRDQQAAKKTTPTVKKKSNATSIYSNSAGDATIKAAGRAVKKTTPIVKKKPNVMSNRAGDAAIKAAGKAASKIKF